MKTHPLTVRFFVTIFSATFDTGAFAHLVLPRSHVTDNRINDVDPTRPVANK